jgi:hypothetical protein
VTDYATPVAAPETTRERLPGRSAEYAVAWVLLILTLAWYAPFIVIVDTGIFEAGQHLRTSGALGPADAGGAGFFLIDVIGAAVLGLAIAYGLFRYYTRDRRLDPLTEAATREAYAHPDPAPR